MKISMIGCPFQTSFGCYISSLRDAIAKNTASPVQWVASNCGCGDPVERGRQFQILDCDYFEMPMPGEYRSKSPWRRRVRGFAKTAVLHWKAGRYANMSRGADVVHFQQVLNAYGSKALFHWLGRPSGAIRVVTVHELDADQLLFPAANRDYNRADAIIVHCEEMRQELIKLGVAESKIHTVLHGTEIPGEPFAGERAGVVYYGGHKLMARKGLETVLGAWAILKPRMGSDTPTLAIHGHYGGATPEEAIQLSRQYEVADQITWRNQIPQSDAVALYQRSQLCVLPWAGSFAGYPAALAAACRLPVVSTRKAGLLDHLGEDGIWIEEANPDQLAERIVELTGNPEKRREIGARLLKRAQEMLSWDVIAERTLEVYQNAAGKRMATLPAAS
jgi:glycosyltransferase involved in cell wall biosynthesis